MAPSAPGRSRYTATRFRPLAAVRRFITILLILLLPAQSVWAWMAVPCAGSVSLPEQVVHALQDGHDHASHPHDTAADHERVSQVGEQVGKPAADELNCAGSAACLSMQSPALGHVVQYVPALQSRATRFAVSAFGFRSISPQPLHRPPIPAAAA